MSATRQNEVARAVSKRARDFALALNAGHNSRDCVPHEGSCDSWARCARLSPGIHAVILARFASRGVSVLCE